jgi:hypothetical protein
MYARCKICVKKYSLKPRKEEITCETNAVDGKIILKWILKVYKLN